MDLIILAWRVLPVQLGLCPPLPNDVPLALNKILFSNHIYLLSVFQTCLTHFLNLTCCPPHLEVCLSRPDSFQKAFYLNFPAYMTSLCTHGSHFTLNIYWPVTALTLWNYFVIECTDHLTRCHCYMLIYRGSAFLCMSLCSLSKVWP